MREPLGGKAIIRRNKLTKRGFNVTKKGETKFINLNLNLNMK